MENTDNVIDFKRMRQGASTGGPTNPENWLSSLDKGSIFLGRFKQQQQGLENMFLHKFMVMEHKTMSTNLLWATPDGGQKDVWVNTLEFSRKCELGEVIGVVQFGHEEQQKMEQVSNEQVEPEVSSVGGVEAPSP